MIRLESVEQSIRQIRGWYCQRYDEFHDRPVFRYLALAVGGLAGLAVLYAADVWTLTI
jgi:hypothetical protein